ncbi:MAG: hypothetical protein ACREQ5_03985 [Candidatus Dormibacteria bacterium]
MNTTLSAGATTVPTQRTSTGQRSYLEQATEKVDLALGYLAKGASGYGAATMVGACDNHPIDTTSLLAELKEMGLSDSARMACLIVAALNDLEAHIAAENTR